MNISIIIPTRSRQERLAKLIESIFSLAKYPDLVELVLVYDNDDEETRDLLNQFQGIFNRQNLIVLNRDRSHNLNNDYLNFAACHTSGKYIWGLGNDNLIITDNWDEVLLEKAEEFLKEKHGRVLYGYVSDDIHNTGDINTVGGCCFPLVSREAYEALGWFFPPEITKWGADHWLWMIYKALPENRMLDLREHLKVLHFCHHNGSAPRDEVNMEMERGSHQNWLSNDAIAYYANKLKERMKNENGQTT
jgi:glycosyltransferase involved in cell wall biosynthesis